ncbi:hypothetical protein ASD62_11720 [Phycicoccus sp. Root563]|uniref:hypothetical protein n=1 Tax=Phycicoccus sp. Root563 TaxID=1736562 RepID=UPI000703AD92|nr:hypothetical protein [Phycicoccus sp. Root563]KQZ89867.1 hypothetical protein ASD62_11720 [Phycicoccus sp. Root563]
MAEPMSAWFSEPLVTTEDPLLEDYAESLAVHEGETVEATFWTSANWANVEGAALITVRVDDAEGNEVVVPDWPSVSPRLGQYKYVEPGSAYSPGRTRVRVTIPVGGVRLTFAGHAWRSGVTTFMAKPRALQRTDAPDSKWFDRMGSFHAIEPGTVSATVTTTIIGGGVKPEERRAALQFVRDGFGPLLPAFGQTVDRHNGAVTKFAKDPSEPHQYVAHFPVPEGATHLRWTFSGADAERIATVGEPVIEYTAFPRDSLQDFLDDLAQGQSLVLIDSTAPPLGSGTITIRPNNLANMYASMGIAVISIGFGRLQGNRRRQSSLVFQAGREEIEDVVALVAAQGRARQCVYVCSSFASTLAVGRSDLLRMNGWQVLYEIRDNMEEFNRVGYSKWYSASSEVLQCLKSDQITTVSPALAEKVAAIAPGRSAVVSPNAIMSRFIEGSVHMRNLQLVEHRRTQGVVGYVGHLTDAWFDWHRYLYAAAQLPSTRFELVGPGIPNYISLPPNVTYLGAVKQDELAEIGLRWCVGLIPFIDSPLTLGVDPNKLFEYCAWGLRTVSARMGSIDDCPTAVTYDSADGFVAEIEKALTTPWSQQELDAATTFLASSSWRARAIQTLDLMGVTW